MKIRFCPKCKGTDIIAVAGMQIGIFECMKCGFRSSLFPEKELKVKIIKKIKKKKEIKKKKRSKKK